MKTTKEGRARIKALNKEHPNMFDMEFRDVVLYIKDIEELEAKLENMTNAYKHNYERAYKFDYKLDLAKKALENAKPFVDNVIMLTAINKTLKEINGKEEKET